MSAWRREVDGSPLVVFRVALGVLLAMAALRHWLKGAIHDAFVVPTHFFAYDGLAFVRPLPGSGMYVVYAALGLAALGLATGWRTRGSAAVACVLFTYAHACDKTNYLNHYYLVSLLLGLAVWLPLGAARVPVWTIWLVRFQLGLVYFYGGVGKLNGDWLVHAMPLRIWLAANGDFPLLGGLLRQPETAYAMSWLGAAFDLSAPFLLSLRRTRPFAYAAVVAFHVVTARLFQIGMFPWIMIALTLVFFDWKRLAFGPKLGVPAWPIPVAWAAFQLFYPLRSHLYPGDVLWTENGYRFSWRVMLIEKAGSAEFTATDPTTGLTRQVRTRDFLTPFQTKMMSTQPDMIGAFGRIIADDAVRHGEPRPIVRADVVVTLNGRPAAPLVDPNVDLARDEPRVLPSPR